MESPVAIWPRPGTAASVRPCVGVGVCVCEHASRASTRASHTMTQARTHTHTAAAAAVAASVFRREAVAACASRGGVSWRWAAATVSARVVLSGGVLLRRDGWASAPHDRTHTPAGTSAASSSSSAVAAAAGAAATGAADAASWLLSPSLRRRERGSSQR